MKIHKPTPSIAPTMSFFIGLTSRVIMALCLILPATAHALTYQELLNQGKILGDAAPISGNSAQCITSTVPASMAVGRSQQVTITLKNSGSTTWPAYAASSNYFAVTPWPTTAGSSLTISSGAQAVLTDVAPGQTYTFTLILTAPATAGNYSGALRMLQQNVDWFGDACGPSAVQVSSQTASPTLTADATTVYSGTPVNVSWDASQSACDQIKVFLNASLLFEGASGSFVKTLATPPLSQNTQITLTCLSFVGQVFSQAVPLNITVNPRPANITNLSIPGNIPGYSSLQGTVQLDAPAGLGGAVITLSDSNPVVTLPQTITVPAGSSQGSFTITTRYVSTATGADITASASSSKQTTHTTVTPPAQLQQSPLVWGGNGVAVWEPQRVTSDIEITKVTMEYDNLPKGGVFDYCLNDYRDTAPNYPPIIGGFSELLCFTAHYESSGGNWAKITDLSNTPLFIPAGTQLACGEAGGTDAQQQGAYRACVVEYKPYQPGDDRYRTFRVPYADQSVDMNNAFSNSYYSPSVLNPTLKVRGLVPYVAFEGHITACARWIDGSQNTPTSGNIKQQKCFSDLVTGPGINYSSPDLIALNWDLPYPDLLDGQCVNGTSTAADCAFYYIVQIPPSISASPENIFLDYGNVPHPFVDNWCQNRVTQLHNNYDTEFCTTGLTNCDTQTKIANCQALFTPAACMATNSCEVISSLSSNVPVAPSNQISSLAPTSTASTLNQSGGQTGVSSSNPSTPAGLLNQTPLSSSGLAMSQDNIQNTSSNINSFPSGSLVNDGGTIYFISGSTKVPFTNWQAFVGLGYSLKNVISGDLQYYTLSTTYVISTANTAHPWASWLLYNGTIYYSTESGLIGVPSNDVFISNGGSWNNVVKANKYDIAVLDANPNLPVLQNNDPRIYK